MLDIIIIMAITNIPFFRMSILVLELELELEFDFRISTIRTVLLCRLF